MLFRIDKQSFLMHAIDYFSYDDLMSMQYIIISAKIANGGRSTTVVKENELYPDIDAIQAYAETKNIDHLKKMYFNMLDEDSGNPYKTNHYHIIIYRDIIDPLLKGFNIVLICDKDENPYIDCLCKYLKKFNIECIDLNELFTTGHCGPIHIDRKGMYNKAVDIKRSVAKQDFEAKKMTNGGRDWLLAHMTKKEKIRELKKYGLNTSDKDLIDEQLAMQWAEENGYTAD